MCPHTPAGSSPTRTAARCSHGTGASCSSCRPVRATTTAELRQRRRPRRAGCSRLPCTSCCWMRHASPPITAAAAAPLPQPHTPAPAPSTAPSAALSVAPGARPILFASGVFADSSRVSGRDYRADSSRARCRHRFIEQCGRKNVRRRL
eukprot:scaffold19366_cov71-Phaeocystis_antarctica.AAC.3